MGNRVIRAFKESATDTAVAAIMNIPLNYCMVSIAFAMGLSAIQTTIMMTAVFTSMALIRKTYIRLHFDKRYRNKSQGATNG
jgi:O-antigen/teichoic acid export membrane protein